MPLAASAWGYTNRCDEPRRSRRCIWADDRENAKGVIALADPLLISQSVQLAALAQNARLPLIFSRRENVEAGGLIS